MADLLGQIDPAVLASTPSMKPPDGAVADFDGPMPWRTTGVSITSVFLALALMFAAVRVYTKTIIVGKGSLDDLTCGLGLLSTIALWIVFLLVITQGFGRHFWDLPLSVTTGDSFIKLNYIIEWFTCIPYIFVKLTFFILYWKIFKTVRWLRIAVVVGGTVVTAVYLVSTLASLIASTRRPGTTWVESLVNCLLCKKIGIPLVAFSLVSDVYILVLPIFGVARLQLRARQKYGVIMVFMSGLGACVCSSVEVYYRCAFDEKADITYTSVRIELIAIVELCVGICITCVPAMSKFLRHVLPSGNSSTSSWRKIRPGPAKRWWRMQRLQMSSEGDSSPLPQGKKENHGRNLLAIPRPILTGIGSFIHGLGDSGNSSWDVENWRRDGESESWPLR
ncbi:MAG: hypothetical protein L6R36_004303 [Xanthoria steineri]|nr:MAG: hypothetical protein L6R36_004303 [Xanthoria steineri]